ncbi:MAG TPA: DegT/DnrJ/EryC1/StrS family aminotransferase [Candidatus Paceibacterota bacterium]|nr:DegT/DnrJ/EryC1/StrS family aminotransferase [Candidatus Paceibacterota bacterium]
MTTIPFYKPSIGEAEINEVVDTLKGGWLTTGPRTKLFEKEFAEWFGRKHAVAVNSCTAALHLALEAIGLKAGDGVLVPTMTFAATAEVVRYFGARPILVDCREEDFNIDLADAERRIRTARAAGQSVVAIMPVHYGGQMGDMAGIQALARRHHLKIVEDAAHCCPSFFRNGPDEPWLRVGTGVDVSCYSFYANKTITTGEGGMATTDNEEYADRMRIMSLHGISRDAWKRYTAEGSWYYEIVAPGYKYNLTDIASAIGIHQLRRMWEFHVRRTEVASDYAEKLSDVEEIELPAVQPDRIHAWHLYVIRLRLDRLSIDRAKFISELQKRGIGASVHWLPLHMHPYYRATYGYVPEDYPVACGLYPEIVSLPIYPGMTSDEVLNVCHSIRAIVSRNLRHAGDGGRVRSRHFRQTCRKRAGMGHQTGRSADAR